MLSRHSSPTNVPQVIKPITLNKNEIIVKMNNYYNLSEDRREVYPAELLESYDFWHSDPKEIAKMSDETRALEVAKVIDAIASYLDRIGVNSAKYRAGSIFYQRMATDIDREKKDGLFRDPYIALFMKETLSFINLLSQLKINSEVDVTKIEGYLEMFPSPDTGQYECLAGVRDAQMTVYMNLATAKMPWIDKVIAECHREFVERWRVIVAQFIDEKYVVHAFSAIEHILGLETKEKDTLEAAKAIPAETACIMLAQYIEELQRKVSQRIADDREETKKYLEVLNSQGYIRTINSNKVKAFLWGKGIAIIDGEERKEAVQYLKKRQHDSELDMEIEVWDLEKLSDLFPQITITDSVTKERPKSFFDANSYEPGMESASGAGAGVGSASSFSAKASKCVAQLILSPDKNDQEAGLQVLALIGSESQAGSSISQFLNFIYEIGEEISPNPSEEKSDSSKEESVLDRGIGKIRELSSSGEVLEEYKRAIEKYKSYKIALEGGLKNSFEVLLTGNLARGGWQEIYEKIAKNPAGCLEVLNRNKDMLVKLIHNPIVDVQLLINAFCQSNESKELGEDKLPTLENFLKLGENISFLAAKYNKEKILNYVVRGFSSSFRSSPGIVGPGKVGLDMLLGGLLRSEVDASGIEVSGLEYLARHNSKTLEEISKISVQLLMSQLSNGENLVHKLAKRGDASVIDIVLRSVDNDGQAYFLLNSRVYDELNGKTPLHFAVENAIRNPSQSGIIDSIMNRLVNIYENRIKSLRADVTDIYLPFASWPEDRNNPLMTAIESGNIEIIEKIAANLVKYHSRLLTSLLYDQERPITNPAIIGALSSKLENQDKIDLLFFHAKSGNAEAFKVIKKSCEDSHLKPGIDGKTLLHVAVEHGNLEVVKYCMQMNSRLQLKDRFSDVPDNNGDNPVMLAAKSRRFDMVLYMVNNGAGFDSHTQTCVFQQGVNYSQELKRQLRDASGDEAKTLELQEKINLQKIRLIELLRFKQVKDLIGDKRSEGGNPPLIRAISQGRGDIARALLEAGLANPYRDLGSKERTALHSAALMNDKVTIEYLTRGVEDGGSGMDPRKVTYMVKDESGAKSLVRPMDLAMRIRNHRAMYAIREAQERNDMSAHDLTSIVRGVGAGAAAGAGAGEAAKSKNDSSSAYQQAPLVTAGRRVVVPMRPLPQMLSPTPPTSRDGGSARGVRSDGDKAMSSPSASIGRRGSAWNAVSEARRVVQERPDPKLGGAWR